MIEMIEDSLTFEEDSQGSVIGAKRDAGRDAGHELMKAEGAELRALMSEVSPAEIAYVLSLATRHERRTELLTAVPAEMIQAVLFHDDQVYRSFDRQDPTPPMKSNVDGEEDGYVHSITRAEAKQLQTQGYGAWVEELDHDALGTVTEYGVRTAICRFSGRDALERLHDILDSDNGREWKVKALVAQPAAYWALALRHEEEALNDRLEQLAEIHEKLAKRVGELLQEPSSELITRLLEHRNAFLVQARAQMPTASAEIVRIYDDLAKLKNAQSVLDDLRKVKSGTKVSP